MSKSPLINLNSLFRTNKDSTTDYIENISKANFDYFHKLKPSKLTGYFDHSREILVSQKKNGVEGYYVITPFFFMDYVMPTEDLSKYKEFFADFMVLKGAIPVNRGWIPIDYKDRRMRPHDQGDFHPETIYGNLRWTDSNVHDYSLPNNAYLGLWNNICPLDFSYYWNLPNKSERTYFEELDFGLDNNYDDGKPLKNLPKEVVQLGVEEKFLLANFQPFMNVGKYVCGLTGGFLLLSSAI
eukprot:CAMPEP_0170529686 /NCGR_PEP_ID=MMETSP0209-20121228/27806_1 /TAXON_ID=665100 ORGANISM="Litonotus pictus, Strain P1" /NCGR_SAMPLE_ID=MMETSP0209 /ASSEMBLY_ACC=CAM_ASM_000301 /LENGTH=239 /DNA_ID=CAMNT_0010821949 /DNA_START=197 /DNA_END=916 /DNA_ORIENTATION=+